VVSEIDGVVVMGAIKRGNREIIIEAKDGVQKKYLVPLTRQILAQDGDFVKAGASLSDGQTAPLDILSIKGPFAVQEYVVNEIQEVYRLQGVKINDKHIEVIVRQMMRKVNIVDPGDTRFLEDDLTDKFDFVEENDYIFDKKVVTEVGDSAQVRAGQIVSLREVREENSILRRSDKKLVEYRMPNPLHLHRPCWVLPRLHWVYRAGFLPLPSRKRPRFFLQPLSMVKPIPCWV
jgi:DNA-directed RNA polymerase subunit beta'